MYTCLPGKTYPVGATVSPTGVNFCVYSRSTTGIDLLLFDQPKRFLQPTPFVEAGAAAVPGSGQVSRNSDGSLKLESLVHTEFLSGLGVNQ